MIIDQRPAGFTRLPYPVTREPESCRHHDKIETPNGPLAAARCVRCGRERVYATAEPLRKQLTRGQTREATSEVR